MGKRINLTNGVSFGAKYMVTAADATAGSITFDCKSSMGTSLVTYPVAASFLVTTDAGVNVALTDAVITYPANGQVTIANGAATFTITEDYIISVIIQRAVITQ